MRISYQSPVPIPSRKHLHDKERVKDLHSIQDGLDNLHLLLGTAPNATVSPWAK
jgi:hypothetical protein